METARFQPSVPPNSLPAAPLFCEALGEPRVNQGQIARLLMQHRTVLYGYIFACVRNHADAEDILQNVSVAVMESIDQLRDESGFLPWSREIARRRILAHKRQAQRERALDSRIWCAVSPRPPTAWRNTNRPPPSARPC